MVITTISRRKLLGAALGVATVPVVGPVATLSATLRPAMRGIFSGGGNQREALLAFVKEAAESGKTIEWGPIDLSIDVISRKSGVRGLIVPSGSRWVMHPDTRVRALPNPGPHYEILNIVDARDIEIEGNGARIVGDREAHAGKGGEWGHGVSIRGSTGVTIRDLVAEDCWGDGFYIGSTASQKFCQDILLQRTAARRARRNGMSLVSARNFLSEDHRSIETVGTAPEFGVDIEPNERNEYLEGVRFVRTLTERSGKVGFGMFLAALEGTENPIEVRLEDCQDIESLVGFSVASAVGAPGSIDLLSVKSARAGEAGISLRRKAASGPHVRIDHPLVTDWNRNGVPVAAAQAAINVFAPAREKGAEALGGVDIIAPDIRLTDARTPSRAAIFVNDQRATRSQRPVGVRLLDPISLAGLPVWLTAERAEFRDGNRVSERKLPDADSSIGTARTYVHNIIGATKSRTYSLASGHPVGIELVFEVASNDAAGRIRFPDGERLYLDARGTGSVWSGQRGATLRIRKTAPDSWTALDIVGVWRSG